MKTVLYTVAAGFALMSAYAIFLTYSVSNTGSMVGSGFNTIGQLAAKYIG